jgi:hypothetical protein
VDCRASDHRTHSILNLVTFAFSVPVSREILLVVRLLRLRSYLALENSI